jgi:hypothetical protein
LYVNYIPQGGLIFAIRVSAALPCIVELSGGEYTLQVYKLLLLRILASYPNLLLFPREQYYKHTKIVGCKYLQDEASQLVFWWTSLAHRI